MATELDGITAAAQGAGEAARQYEMLADTIQQVKTGVSALGSALLGEACEPMEAVAGTALQLMSTLQDAFDTGGFAGLVGAAEGFDVLAEAAGAAAQQIVTNVTAVTPALLEAGASLVQAFLSSALTAIPAFVQGLAEFGAVLVEAVVELGPSLLDMGIQVIAQLAIGIGQALPTLIPILAQGLAVLAMSLVENLPLFIDAMLQLINGLLEGLVAAWPLLAAAIPQIVDGLVTALLGAIPQIAEVGVNLLVALVENLPAIIEGICGAIPQIIEGIAASINEMLPALIECGVALFTALVENLPAILEGVCRAIPQIIEAVVQAFGSLAGRIMECGVNLVKGFWAGIQSMASWIWEKVSGFFQSIVDSVKDFLGIHSPSSLFRDEVGKMMAQGVGIGFTLEAPKEFARIRQAVAAEQGALTQRLQTRAALGSALVSAGVQEGSLTVNVEVHAGAINNELDIDWVARELGARAARQIRQRGGISFA